MKSAHSTKKVLAGIALVGLVTGSAGRVHASVPCGVSTISGNASAGLLADDASMGKHDCKGMNACKGQGGCKSSDNGCKGKNDCKGKGGCSTKMPASS